MGQLFKFRIARHKISFTKKLNKYANFSAAVHISVHNPFVGCALGFFGGLKHTAFAQIRSGFFNIALSFLQRFFRVKHTSAGLLAKLHDKFWIDHNCLSKLSKSSKEIKLSNRYHLIYLIYLRT